MVGYCDVQFSTALLADLDSARGSEAWVAEESVLLHSGGAAPPVLFCAVSSVRV